MRPENVALSPNGGQIAFVGRDTGRDVIAVVLLRSDGPAETPKPRPTQTQEPGSSSAGSLQPSATPAADESPDVGPSPSEHADQPRHQPPRRPSQGIRHPHLPGHADADERRGGYAGSSAHARRPTDRSASERRSRPDRPVDPGRCPFRRRTAGMVDGWRSPGVQCDAGGRQHRPRRLRVAARRRSGRANNNRPRLLLRFVVRRAHRGQPDHRRHRQERDARGGDRRHRSRHARGAAGRRSADVAAGGRSRSALMRSPGAASSISSGALPTILSGELYLVDWTALDPFGTDDATGSGDPSFIPIDPDRDPIAEPVLTGTPAGQATAASWASGKRRHRAGRGAACVLAEFDPESGALELADPLFAKFAKRGFSLGLDRVAWVSSPTDENPEGELRIRTWGTDGVGDLRIESLDAGGARSLVLGTACRGRG